MSILTNTIGYIWFFSAEEAAEQFHCRGWDLCFMVSVDKTMWSGCGNVQKDYKEAQVGQTRGGWAPFHKYNEEGSNPWDPIVKAYLEGKMPPPTYELIEKPLPAPIDPFDRWKFDE